jgi:hypothetical protein
MIGISEIKMQLEVAEKEIASLEGGRKASAARARKSLQIIKGLAHALRKNIVEFSKGLPTKKRAEVKVAAEPIVPIVATEPITPKRKRASKKEITTI